MNPYLYIVEQPSKIDTILIDKSSASQASKSITSGPSMHDTTRRHRLYQRLQALIDFLHQKSMAVMDQRLRLERQAVACIKEAACNAKKPVEEQLASLVNWQRLSWQRSLESSTEDLETIHRRIDQWEIESLGPLEERSTMPSLSQLFFRRAPEEPQSHPPILDDRLDLDQNQKMTQDKTSHRDVSQQTEAESLEPYEQLLPMVNLIERDSEMKLLRDAYKMGLAEIQSNHIREVDRLKESSRSQISRLSSEIVSLKQLLNDRGVLSTRGMMRSVADKEVQAKVVEERKEPITKEVLAELLANSSSERAAETRIQIYRLQDHYETKIDLMKQEMIQRQSEIDDMKALLQESHKAIVTIRRSQEQQSEINNFRRRLVASPNLLRQPMEKPASQPAPPQPSSTIKAPTHSPSFHRSSSTGLPDYRDAKKTPSKSTPHPRRGLFMSTSNTHLGPSRGWDQIDAPPQRQERVDYLGSLGCRQVDGPACIRCGLNDLISPGICAFHPALLADPGPLLFSDWYNLCSSLCHSSSDKPCYSRHAHTYPQKVTVSTSIPSRDPPTRCSSPTAPWIPPSPTPLPRSIKSVPAALTLKR